MQRVAGKDASKQFWKYHNESILKKYQKNLQVGSVEGSASASNNSSAAPPTPPATPPATPPTKPKQEVVQVKAESGTGSVVPGPAAKQELEILDQFGDMIPGGDPAWYQSVYY